MADAAAIETVTRPWFVIYEAPADFETATTLADRVLVDAVDWLDESQLDSQRLWVREWPAGQPLTWPAIARRARDSGIRAHGHFDGEPGAPDAVAARRAMHYLMAVWPEPVRVVVLIRDSDRQPQRRAGLQQAIKAHRSLLAAVIGLAEPCREAWILAGFEPANDDEVDALCVLNQELGFDPRDESHKLSAKSDVRRSAKGVVARLTADDHDRQRRCWCESSLNALTTRRAHNGLAIYLSEVRRHLVPLIVSARAEGQ